MAVPSTNTSLEDIQTEFGGSNPISISEYYLGGSNVQPGSPHLMDLFHLQDKFQ